MSELYNNALSLLNDQARFQDKVFLHMRPILPDCCVTPAAFMIHRSTYISRANHNPVKKIFTIVLINQFYFLDDSKPESLVK